MPTYPTSPPVHQIEDEGLEWNALTAEFDNIVRHARTRLPFPIRVVRLTYENLNTSERNTLQTFFDARRARAERFDFTNPRSSDTYKARFRQDALVWAIKKRSGPTWDVVIVVEEAP